MRYNGLKVLSPILSVDADLQSKNNIFTIKAVSNGISMRSFLTFLKLIVIFVKVAQKTDVKAQICKKLPRERSSARFRT